LLVFYFSIIKFCEAKYFFFGWIFKIIYSWHGIFEIHYFFNKHLLKLLLFYNSRMYKQFGKYYENIESCVLSLSHEFVGRVATFSQCILLIQSKSISNVFEPCSKSSFQFQIIHSYIIWYLITSIAYVILTFHVSQSTIIVYHTKVFKTLKIL
jgi:hypothetical protein